MPPFLLLAGLLVARACEIVPYPPEFAVGTGPAGPSPEAPVVRQVEIRRALHGPPGCGDCGEIGHLHIRLDRAGDWDGSVGVTLQPVAGQVPEGMVLPPFPVEAPQGDVSLAFVDHPLRPVELTLEATLVDRSGAASAPVRVQVRDGGGARTWGRRMPCLGQGFLLLPT